MLIVFGIIDDQVIAIGLAGEDTVDGLRLEPAILQCFLASCFSKAGIELGFEFFPFGAMRILGAPRKAVKLIEAEMLEYDLQRHIFDHALAPLERMRDRFTARPSKRVAVVLRCSGICEGAPHFHIRFSADLLKQGRFALLGSMSLVHRFQAFEGILAVETHPVRARCHLR